MSVKIRLARFGAKKKPFYRIVVTSSRSPRDGKFIERIGSYNPMLAKDKNERVVLNNERLLHWLNVGAIPSERVAKFCIERGIAHKGLEIFKKALEIASKRPAKPSKKELKKQA